MEAQIAAYSEKLEQAGTDYKALEECCNALETLRTTQEELTEQWLLLNEE